MHSTRHADDENMELSCPEKRTIRFRGTTAESQAHVPSNDKRVENVDPSRSGSQLSEMRVPEEKQGTFVRDHIGTLRRAERRL